MCEIKRAGVKTDLSETLFASLAAFSAFRRLIWFLHVKAPEPYHSQRTDVNVNIIEWEHAFTIKGQTPCRNAHSLIVTHVVPGPLSATWMCDSQALDLQFVCFYELS